MAIIKQHDPRSHITYVYESKSYWDKDKKQSRSKRTLIGRLDETTGEIVPTDGRGRKRKCSDGTENVTPKNPDNPAESQMQELTTRIQELEIENQELKRKNAFLVTGLKSLLESIEKK